MREEDFYHLEDPTWCGGCGLYGIFSSLKKVAVSLKMDPEELVVVTGIGCHGRLNNYFKCYGFHALHGRTLPVATGVKLANPGLHVLAVSGDGDAYSIGLGHFLHTARKNMDIVFIVVDNRVYALTQGQTSPTSQQGYVSISTPFGSKEKPLDGLQLALSAGATFVARGFSGDPSHLVSLIEKGIKHKGFAVIEVLSPCVTHNKINTHQWFRENTYKLEGEKGFDPEDRVASWKRLDQTDKIPLGLIFQEERPSYQSLVLASEDRPLVFGDLKRDVSRLDKIMEEFE